MEKICPSCQAENLPGDDRCRSCLHSLMERELPRPKKNDALQRVMMTAPIGSLLTGKDLLVAKPTDTVDMVVKIFQKEQKNCVLIYEQKKLVGIISQTDLLRKAAGKSTLLTQISLQEVMTPKPEFVKADDSIAVAVNKMALGGFRHIPVLREDGTPYSIIYIKDVISYLCQHKRSSSPEPTS